MAEGEALGQGLPPEATATPPPRESGDTELSTPLPTRGARDIPEEEMPGIIARIDKLRAEGLTRTQIAESLNLTGLNVVKRLLERARRVGEPAQPRARLEDSETGAATVMLESRMATADFQTWLASSDTRTTTDLLAKLGYRYKPGELEKALSRFYKELEVLNLTRMRDGESPILVSSLLGSPSTTTAASTGEGGTGKPTSKTQLHPDTVIALIHDIRDAWGGAMQEFKMRGILNDRYDLALTPSAFANLVNIAVKYGIISREPKVEEPPPPQEPGDRNKDQEAKVNFHRRLTFIIHSLTELGVTTDDAQAAGIQQLAGQFDTSEEQIRAWLEDERKRAEVVATRAVRALGRKATPEDYRVILDGIESSTGVRLPLSFFGVK